MRIPFAQVQVEGIPSAATPALADVERAGKFAAVAGEGLAQGIATALEATGKAVAKIDEARTETEISNKMTAAHGELADYRTELEKDPDFKSRSQKFEAKAQEIRDRLSSGLYGPAAERYQQRFDQVYRPLSMSVKHDARQEEVQVFKGDLITSLDKLANNSVFAKTPLERESIQAEAKKQIDEAMRTGYLTASQAKDLQKGYLGKVDAALAQEMVRANPGAAIAAMGDPNQFPYLDASQRVQIRAHAQARLESLGAQARAEARADAAEFMQGLSGAFRGEPMPPVEERDAILKRVGPNSAVGVKIRHAWDFAEKFTAAAAGNSIPDLQKQITDLRTSGGGAGQGPLLTHDGLPAVKNADGSVSTEISITVTDPRLNGGKPTNIPSLWGGKVVSQDQAVENALKSGKTYTAYDTIPQAVEAAKKRSEEKGAAIKQPSSEDLRLARALEVLLQRKQHERDNDPKLHAQVNETVQALTKTATGGKQPDANEVVALLNRVGGSDTAMGAALQRAWDFSQAVNGVSSYSIPQLQAEIDRLRTAESSMANIRQMTTLQTVLQHKIAENEKDPNLHADVEQFVQMAAAAAQGGKLTSEGEYLKLLDRAGGAGTPSGARVQRAYEFASKSQTEMAGKSIEEIAAKVNELRGTNATPDNLALATVLSTGVQHRIQARDRDPYAYVFQQYPTLKEKFAEAEAAAKSNDFMVQQTAPELRKQAFDFLIATQLREGVRPDHVVVMAKGMAEEVKTQLAVADPKERANAIDSLRQTYGEYWPRVMSQIYKDQPAPPDVLVLGSLPTGAAIPKQVISEAYKVSDEEGTKILGHKVKTTIEEQARDASQGLASSLHNAPKGPHNVAAFQTVIERVARLYVMQGDDPTKAVQRAADDVFYKHWTLSDPVHGVSVRIPNSQGVPDVTPAQVNAAQRSVRSQLQKLDLLVPTDAPGMTDAARKTQYVNVLKSQGFWMSTADEKGMVLMAGPNRPVRFADGTFVAVGFDSVKAYAEQAGAAGAVYHRPMGKPGEPDEEPSVTLPFTWFKPQVQPGLGGSIFP